MKELQHITDTDMNVVTVGSEGMSFCEGDSLLNIQIMRGLISAPPDVPRDYENALAIASTIVDPRDNPDLAAIWER